LNSKARSDSNLDIREENECTEALFNKSQLNYDDDNGVNVFFEEPLTGSYMRRVLCETKVAGVSSIDNFTRNNNFENQAPEDDQLKIFAKLDDAGMTTMNNSDLPQNAGEFNNKNSAPVENDVQNFVDEKSAIIDGEIFKERNEKTLDFHDINNPEGILVQRKQIGDQIYEVTEYLKDGKITKTHVTTEMTDEQIMLFGLKWESKWIKRNNLPQDYDEVSEVNKKDDDLSSTMNLNYLEKKERFQNPNPAKNRPENLLQLQNYDYKTDEQQPLDKPTLDWIMEEASEETPLGHQIKTSFVDEGRNF